MMANQRKFLDHVAKYAAEHNWRLTIPNDGIAPTMWEGDGALVSFSRSREQMNFAKRLSRRATPCVGLSYALPRPPPGACTATATPTSYTIRANG